MEMMRTTQTRPDTGRRQRGEADIDDDAIDKAASSEGAEDLYDVLGFRRAVTTVTTQQWLSMRCISF